MIFRRYNVDNMCYRIYQLCAMKNLQKSGSYKPKFYTKMHNASLKILIIFVSWARRKLIKVERRVFLVVVYSFENNQVIKLVERFFIYVENWKYFPRFIELVYSIKVNEHIIVSRFIAWATQSSNSGRRRYGFCHWHDRHGNWE